MGKAKKLAAPAVQSASADINTGEVTLVLNFRLVGALGEALSAISNADNADIAALGLSAEQFGAISLIANTIGDCTCPDCFPAINEGI